MKKLFVMLMAVAAITFVSCSGESTSDQSNDSLAQVATKEIEFDLEGFKAKLDEAIKGGDKAAATQILDAAMAKIDQEKTRDGAQREAVAGLWAKIKAAVDERAEDLKKLGVDEAVNKITNVPEDMKQDVDKFVQQYVEQGKQVAEDVAGEAVDKANEATQQVADKANEAADNAQQAANNAADKAKEAANKAVDDAANAVKNAIR